MLSQMRLAPAALLLLTALSPAQTQHKSSPDPRLQAELAAARAPNQQPADAILHWKRAIELSDTTCVPCFEHIANLSFRIGDWTEAISAAANFERYTASPADQAYAELLRASATLHLHDDQPTPAELEQAHSALQAAVSNDPKLRSALFLDGRTLAALHRDPEASDAFHRYLALSPTDDPYRARAQNYLDTIALARSTMAPPFHAVTSTGVPISLDQLHGQVVLLDFWATWCVPCQQLLPRLQHLSSSLAGQPFTLLSISWDEDPVAWKHFTATHNMTWPQVLDTDHKLSSTYSVDALPHYFTIDADGALQSETIGVGDDHLEARITALVAAAKQKSATTNQSSAPTHVP